MSPVAAIVGEVAAPHELRPAAMPAAAAVSPASTEPNSDAPSAPASDRPGDGDAPASSWRFNAVSLVAGVWLLGIGVGIGAQIMALLQLRRLTAAGAPLLDSPLMAQAALRAGLRRTPSLYVSSATIEPLVVVHGSRPLILVAGQDLDRLSPDEQLALFTHECVHVRRGDLWLSVVPWLAGTLFWFLPPIYAALREFQLAREAACDQDTVVALALKPRAYAKLLVKLFIAGRRSPFPRR